MEWNGKKQETKKEGTPKKWYHTSGLLKNSSSGANGLVRSPSRGKLGSVSPRTSPKPVFKLTSETRFNFPRYLDHWLCPSEPIPLKTQPFDSREPVT